MQAATMIHTMWTVCCNAIQYSSQMHSFVGEQLARQIASLMSYITLLADVAPLSEHAIVASWRVSVKQETKHV